MAIVKLFHGSPSVVNKPVFGFGNPRNDYGLGFYTTESLDLAKEWACPKPGENGFANEYTLDNSGLTAYSLSSGNYHILNWMALLLKHRIFKITQGIAENARAYLLSEFSPDVDDADVLIGYRADDSYFSFANAFLNNGLSLRQLETAMHLGNLGEQVVLKSEKAFQRLAFIQHHIADGSIYYPKRMTRDTLARRIYREQVSIDKITEDTYVLDIIRGRWENDDPRLSRNIPE